MKILDKILKGSATELTDSIGGVLDNVITNEGEKLQAKKAISEIATNKMTEVISYQRDVLLAEMKGNKLQRSWRPIVMLTFAFIVFYSKFLASVFGLPNTELEPDFWELLKIGIGGYVVGRSVEKVTDKITKNIDLPFLKKKDRSEKI